ncbi:hypothetical protein ABPG74_012804 [Tetrahymena malaccensis]
MACQYLFSGSQESQRNFVEDLEFMKLAYKKNSLDYALEKRRQDDLSSNIINLPRGGLIIKTKIGNIQYGLPPETVKDSLKLGLTVPTYFIIPSNRFDRKSGINVAEFEFPAYFNFFCNKKQICLICTKSAKKDIQNIFQETLIGPVSHENLSDDFYHKVPTSSYPDFINERKIFSSNPLNPSEDIKIDTLLNFKVFNDITKNAIIQENGVTIEITLQNQGFIEIKQDNETIAYFQDQVELTDSNKSSSSNLNLDKGRLFKKNSMCCSPCFETGLKLEDFQESNTPTQTFQRTSSTKKNSMFQGEFVPPDFGVTILGSSHGFDPNGSTSGFIIWIYGRGIMVDPPPFSNDYLKSLGINYQLINGIIISHCHADHDAGAFHKIVADQKIEVITTRTIMNSFLRKYSAVSQIDQEQLKRLFVFRPVIIGTTLKIYGANFNFFYSFHTIPSLGFEVEVNNKRLYFSSDTYYNPKQIKQYYADGRISKERCSQLADIDFSRYDLILHEAGVPPIHTPQSILADLPEHVKEKLYLIHIAHKDLLPNSGLKIPGVGIQDTITIIDKDTHSEIKVLKRLDILSKVDLFEDLSIKHAKHLMDAVQVEEYQKGDIIFKEGDIGHKFFIIQYGAVRIYTDNEFIQIDKVFKVGDYFGEGSLLDSSNKRIAQAEAITDCQLLTLERHDFHFLFGGSLGGKGIVIQKLKQLNKARNCQASDIVNKNSIFSELEQGQKTQLEMIMKEVVFEQNQILWRQGEQAQYAFLVKEGLILFFKQNDEVLRLSDEEIQEINRTGSFSCISDNVDTIIESEDNIYGPLKFILSTGAFIGDTKAIHTQSLMRSYCVCKTRVKAFQILSNDFQNFLAHNPGLKLLFEEKEFFE